jgi:UrcA family protein
MNTIDIRQDFPAQPWNRFPAHSAFALVAGALMLFVGGAAWAADSTAPPALLGPVLTEKTLVVKFGDLDLATDSGTRLAKERVRDASRKACDYTTNAGDYVVGRNEVFRDCLDRTMAAANGQLEELRLAALLQSGAKVAGNEAAEPASPALKVSGSP